MKSLHRLLSVKRKDIQRQVVHDLSRSHVILSLGVFMVIVVTLTTLALVSWRHEQVLAKARSDLRNVATLLSTQSHHAFQGIDVLQQLTLDRLAANDIHTPESLRTWAGQREVHRFLSEAVGRVDILDAAAIVDTTGQLLTYSRGWPTPDLNVSDREYFQVLLHSDLDALWSEPVLSRGNGTLTIYRVRKIAPDGGKPIGMLLSMVGVQKLGELYASIELPTASSIGLFREDGVTLARQPSEPRDRRPDATLWQRFLDLKETGQRTVIFSEAQDGAAVLTAISALPGDPLFVTVSSPVSAVLAEWRKEAVITTGLAVLLNVVIGIAGILGLRQLKTTQERAHVEWQAARHDPLTTLANRVLFREHLDALLTDGSRPDFSLLLLDLDRFKEVNDTYGHATGDELLLAVTKRLRQAVGSDDLVARLAGDEFAIIHKGNSVRGECPAIAANVLAALARPFALTDCHVVISASIGTVSAAEGHRMSELLANADLALFRAKENGRNEAIAYAPQMHVDRRERLDLLRDLRQAVEQEDFELYYQPIINLHSGEIASFEALLRWKHPTRGFVSPAKFVGLAEESGLINTLGNWVLRQACKQARKWPDHISVAINLSPVQLRTGDIYEQTKAALKAAELPANRLTLEITETVQLEHTAAGKVLRDLKSLGVRVSLDDFGTGYAALSYLWSFPFDLIKLDQSFVREMHRSPECAVIVQTVLDMGDRLGIDVTAEGVETLEQLETLRQKGCAKAQGYVLGRPMPAGRVMPFILNWQYPALDTTLALAG